MAPQPTPPPPATHSPGPPLLPASFHSDPSMWAVVDPDIPRDNPVEDKHRRLVRSHRSSPYDRELKPNTKLRDELGVRSAFFVDWHRLKRGLKISGHLKLCAKPGPNIRRKRSGLEIPVLPLTRQARPYQVCEIGDMAGPYGSETSCGGAASHVD